MGRSQLLPMKIVTLFAAVAGLVIIALLFAWQDAGAVMGSLGTLGWGVVLLPLAWLPYPVVAAESWRVLFLDRQGPGLVRAVRAFWVGHAVGALLPTAGVGEPVVKVRMLVHDRLSGVAASASVVVDKTVEALSLIVWGLVGVAVLVATQTGDDVVVAALVGSALIAAGTVGFIAVQRAGAFGFVTQRIFGLSRTGDGLGLADKADEVDATIRRLYDRAGRIAWSTALRTAARSLMTIEILVAAYLMGQPLTLWEAVMLRSLASALNGAAFVVPGGLGVQEGAFVALGAVAGLSPESMLALSLATRGRELLVGVPGVLAWKHAEGKALLKRVSPGRDG